MAHKKMSIYRQSISNLIIVENLLYGKKESHSHMLIVTAVIFDYKNLILPQWRITFS